MNNSRLKRVRKTPEGAPMQPDSVGARPMPKGRNAAPSRTTRPQVDAKSRERAARDSAMAKASQALDVPTEALEGFSLEELQVLPKAMAKLDAVVAQRKASESMVKRGVGEALRKLDFPGEKARPQMDDDLKREMTIRQKRR